MMRLFFEVSKDSQFYYREMRYICFIKWDNMDINSLTANRIKELRLETGKSQEIIAKEMGLSKSAYERLENGKIDISLKSLEVVASYYSVTVNELITQKNGTSYHCENSQALAIQQGNNQTFNFNVSKEDIDKVVEVLSKIKGGAKSKK
jgi:transcriptional regulator with XRE-family HTH domain